MCDSCDEMVAAELIGLELQAELTKETTVVLPTNLTRCSHNQIAQDILAIIFYFQLLF